MRIIALVAALLIVAGHASARTDFREWAEFRAMMRAQDDISVVLAFVDRAVAEDRTELAAQALARLIRFYPADRDLRVRLSKLNGVPVQIEDNIQVSGGLALGFGYDTNPGSSPRNNELSVIDPGTNLAIAVDFGLREDESPLAFAQGFFRVRKKDDQNGPDYSFTASAFVIDYSAVDDQNDTSLSFRNALDYAFEAYQFTPYLVSGGRLFDGGLFSVEQHVGGEVQKSVSSATRVSSHAQIGYIHHFNTTDAPDRTDEDGWMAELEGEVRYEFSDSLFLRTTATLGGLDAIDESESYLSAGLSTGLTKIVTAPSLSRDFVLSFGGSATVCAYLEPDDTIDPTEKRTDLSLTAFAGVATPLTEQTAIDLSLALRRNHSSYDITDTRGLRATMRLVRRF